MLFGFVLNTFLVLVTLFAAPIGAVDQDTTVQLGVIRHKPFGPFYCKARCVALCLDNNLAPNITSCVEKFCSNFDENTPCPHADSACWRNCGRRLEGDYSIPLPIQGIEAKFDQLDGNEDPYTVRIDWAPLEGVHLYILEIFPVVTAFGPNEEKIVQLLTPSTSYLFHKPDLCRVYMARLMAVTGFGWSAPRYKRLNGWTQSLADIDLNLKVRSMVRSSEDPFPVKVFLEYKKPSTWESGDVEIIDSNVRAFDCNKAVQSDSGFGDTKPDREGFYWPLVFINDSNSEIELSFPADAMYPQCKFLFKILAMKTRCGMTTTFDDQDKKNEVPFAMSCQNVRDANCDTRPSLKPVTFRRIIDPAPPRDDSGRDVLRPLVFGKPYGTKKDPEPDNIPSSPWTASAVNNDTLWLLFESFLRGVSEGLSATTQANQAKDRRRTMAVAPDETDTTLPPAPVFPTDSGSQEQDELNREFMEAFVKSIDGEDSALTESQPGEGTTALPSSTSQSRGVESDMVPVTGRPQVTSVKVRGMDDSGWSAKPIPQVTTAQILSFVSLVALVLLLVIFVLWFTARRSRRKEHIVSNA